MHTSLGGIESKARSLKAYVQKVEWRLLASLSALNVMQTLIVWAGLSAGLIVCVKVVSQ